MSQSKDSGVENFYQSILRSFDKGMRDLYGHDWTDQGHEVWRIQFNFKPGEVLIVLRAIDKDGKDKVAFCGGDDFFTAQKKLFSVFGEDLLKWRDNKD